MQPSSNTEFCSHHLHPSNPNQYPPHHFNSINNTSAFQLSRFSNNPLYHLHQITQFQDFTACFSSSTSTSDEADEQNLSLINERRQRRMISNRESARRSRMRKQKHLDELWSQVNWLRNENHQLLDKLNHVAESHEQVVQENVQLKEEASELRQMLTGMQINSPYPGL